ncbi:MAG: signal peptidase II [Patescibacteria group bacterium]
MTLKQKIVSFSGGLVVLADELLKILSLKYLPDESQMSGKGIIELAIHKNYGIAFDLPLWLPVVMLLTVFILVGLIFLTKQNWKRHPWEATGSLLIACGAVGNLIDRFCYGFTVDYIIFPLTGSAFNLSDLVIIGGLIILLLSRQKNKK